MLGGVGDLVELFAGFEGEHDACGPDAGFPWGALEGDGDAHMTCAVVFGFEGHVVFQATPGPNPWPPAPVSGQPDEELAQVVRALALQRGPAVGRHSVVV